MRVHRVGGAGNCLFLSCGYHLGVNHHRLRQQVAHIIDKYPHLPIQNTTLSQWIEMSGYCPRKYAEYIAKDGVYGTGLELAIISIIYKRSIIVMKENRGSLQKIAEYFPEFGNPMHLLFSGPASGGHYDVLIF